MTEIDHIKNLLRKLLLEDLDTDEHAALEAWAAKHAANRELLDKYRSGQFMGDLKDFHNGAGRIDETYTYVMDNSRSTLATPSHWGLQKHWVRYVAAAVLLVAITAAAWMFYGEQTIPKSNVIGSTTTSEDIEPAGNRATLTLPDGRTVALKEAQSGIVIGDDITYVDGSAVLHSEEGAAEIHRPHRSAENSTHKLVLSTPKGGTYQITLPDGTNVWLNAASTLRYPNRFSETERVVEFEGEAFFAVAREEDRPFRVISTGQQIEVLGTSFNLSAYGDDSVIKTTLVNGSVRVIATHKVSLPPIVLIPGEQSSMSNDHAHLAKAGVNVRKELAWKEGLFYFEQTTFEELLRQVGRWYDVNIQYEGQLPKESFSGIMSRGVTLKVLIEYLRESSSVEFILEGQTLLVRPKE